MTAKIKEQGRHFITGQFVSRASFVSPKTYRIVRDNIVRGCIECLVVNDKRNLVLLGKRIIEPWPNWWTFGSRIIVGESPEQACAKTMKNDLGVKVGLKRFTFLDVFSLTFDKRQESPQENGCHDITLFHLIPISPKEAAVFKFRKTEYQSIKWFSPNNVIKKGSGFHPATKRIIKEAIKKKLLH